MKIKFNKLQTSKKSISIDLGYTKKEYSDSEYNNLLQNGVEIDQFKINAASDISIKGSKTHYPEYDENIEKEIEISKFKNLDNQDDTTEVSENYKWKIQQNKEEFTNIKIVTNNTSENISDDIYYGTKL
jgi:hypothetical protein